MQIEKFFAYQIEDQFPAIYKEDGQELIALLKAYYDFMETDSRQSTYQSRRLYEYRDIDTTLESMLVFFSKKNLNNLPLSAENTRFIVKHILNFYRRKGTQEGLETFFRLFYNEAIDVYYPSEAMLKVSESNWNQTIYLQMFPNDPSVYRNISGRKIYGTISKAEATANKVLFMYLNGNMVPVIFLNNVKGSFVGFDTIISRSGDELFNYGRVHGSMDNVDIDLNFFEATTGNRVGDMLTFENTDRVGGKLIVTDVSTSFTGEISYRILDGGFGYTRENTELLVSNQILFFDANTALPDLDILEVLSDTSGNSGEVIGFRDNIVGVRLFQGQFFSNTSIISDSSSNVLTFEYVTEKNDTSPGTIITEAANTEIDFAAQVEELSYVEEVSLITDVIGDFLNVPLDSLNYNDIPPALQQMSGNTDPVDIDTALEDAFDLTPFEIGRIVSFKNVNPGRDYTNEVFALSRDPVMSRFKRNDQIVTLGLDSASLTTNAIIKQTLPSGKVVQGIIRRKVINNNPNSLYVASLYVTTFSYYGFQDDYPIVFNNVEYEVLAVSRNYDSDIYGLNASIRATTEFAEGKILGVNVIDSGFGYQDNAIENLYDSNGVIAARGIIDARGTGVTEGSWTSTESHINGFLEDGIEYYDGGKRVQDSFYYQDFSYEISAKVGINTYEKTLKDIAHVAGTKVFGKFNLEDIVELPSSISIRIVLNYEEPIITSDLVGADTSSYTADSTEITADNYKQYKYSADNSNVTVDITGVTIDLT
jgi:hypothetical protein